MLDLSSIRHNADRVRQALASRHSDFDLDGFLERDARRREQIQQVEALQAERNETSKQVGELKRSGREATEIALQRQS